MSRITRHSPEQLFAWQRRSAQAAIRRKQQRFREGKFPKRSRSKKRRDDSAWRQECLDRRGEYCRSCGDTAHVQVDHVWPRSQGGPSVVENGLPLCGEFSRNTPGGCHPAKTASRMLIERSWLDDDQIAWLDEVGWVRWSVDGEPEGRGWKHFARRRSPGVSKEGAR